MGKKQYYPLSNYYSLYSNKEAPAYICDTTLILNLMFISLSTRIRYPSEYYRQHKFYINITKYYKSKNAVFNSSFHKSLGMPKNVWHIVNLISITILFQTQSCNARSTIK